MVELQFIKNNLHDNNFVNTEWNYQEHLVNKILKNVVRVQNQLKEPKLCGDFVVVFQKAIPWGWSEKSKENQNAS